MTGSEVKGMGLRGWFTSRPWLVVGVAAAVVLGPAATTASALQQANAAPAHKMPHRSASAVTTALVVVREDRHALERTR